MAKGYIKPTFGFEPIDNEPFLKDVTFPTVAEASAHAKNGVSSYPGKILTVATGSSTTIYQVNPDKSIEAIPTVSGFKSYVDSSLSALRTHVDAQDSSLKTYVDSSLSALKKYVDSQDDIIDASIIELRKLIKDTETYLKTYIDGSINAIRSEMNALHVVVDSSLVNIFNSIDVINASLNKVAFIEVS